MYTISISQEIKEACPVFAGAAVYAKVRNTTYSEGLWREINAFTEQLTSTTQMEDIKRQPLVRHISVVVRTPDVIARRQRLCAVV